MESLGQETNQSDNRRQRLHELLIALIQREGDLELMDADSPDLKRGQSSSPDSDPARWLDRNRRIMNKYQSLVRSAITLDALLDSE